jgi:hypothetical protein
MAGGSSKPPRGTILPMIDCPCGLGPTSLHPGVLGVLQGEVNVAIIASAGLQKPPGMLWSQKHRRFLDGCLSALPVSWAGGPVLLDKTFNQGFYSWIWMSAWKGLWCHMQEEENLLSSKWDTKIVLTWVRASPNLHPGTSSHSLHDFVACRSHRHGLKSHLQYWLVEWLRSDL